MLAMWPARFSLSPHVLTTLVYCYCKTEVGVYLCVYSSRTTHHTKTSVCLSISSWCNIIICPHNLLLCNPLQMFHIKNMGGVFVLMYV